MTADAWVKATIVREGGFVNRRADRGGPTKYGITARTLGAVRHLGRDATAEEVKALTVAEASAILRTYLAPFAWIPFEDVRAQVADFAVHSGVLTATLTLQRVVGVTADGIVGPVTRGAVATADPRLLNAAIVGARLGFLVRLVEADPTQRANLWGWCRRIASFL